MSSKHYTTTGESEFRWVTGPDAHHNRQLPYRDLLLKSRPAETHRSATEGVWVTVCGLRHPFRGVYEQYLFTERYWYNPLKTLKER
jgi:hypothetical protein